MAKHWSEYVPNVSNKQAYALDKIAEANGMGDGMGLLMEILSASRSKVSKEMASAVTARHAIDKAFNEYGTR